MTPIYDDLVTETGLNPAPGPARRPVDPAAITQIIPRIPEVQR